MGPRLVQSRVQSGLYRLNVGKDSPYTPLGALAEGPGPTNLTVPFVPDKVITAPEIGRTLQLIGGAGPRIVYTQSYGASVPVSIHLQNRSLPGPTESVMTLRIVMAAGFGAESVTLTSIGPGEAVTVPVAGRCQIEATADINNNDLSLWTTLQPMELHPPAQAGFLLNQGVAFIGVPPNQGWPPPQRRWLHVQSTGNYNLRIEDRAGVQFANYVNVVPPRRPFIVPPGFLVRIAANAGNVSFVFTWTQKLGW